MKAKSHVLRLVSLVLPVFSFLHATSQTNTTINADYTGANAISTCFGIIAASGGNTNPVYGNNEDYTFTVCSDTPGDFVSVEFSIFNLDSTDTNPAPNQNNQDVMYVYDGTDTGALLLGNYVGTDAQGALIQATPQNTTGCLTFRFVSNNGGPPGQYSASASCQTPCATPQADGAIVGGITEDSIRVCVGEVITFQEGGSFAQTGFNLINYTWDFDDGTQTSVTNPGATVDHAFSEPGYYLVQLFVQDDNPDNVCTNTNFISLKVLVATEPNFSDFQEDVGMCIGGELTIIATPELYEQTYYGDGGLVEVDNGCLTDTALGVAQNIDISLTDYIDGAVITSVDQIDGLCLTMEHSFMGDLVIYVTCPTGQQLMLHQQGGGFTDLGIPNLGGPVDCDDETTWGESLEYCFTPVATDTWVEASGGNNLVPGDYEPIGTFADLIGCPANGIWTLTIVDNWLADDGQVISFSLNLGPELYPDEFEFTPQILPGPGTSYWGGGPYTTINDSNLDEITISPTVPGVYTYDFTVVDDFGCQNDTSFTVTVYNANQVIAPADFLTACVPATMTAEFVSSTGCADCFTLDTYCYSDNETWEQTYCTDTPGDGAGITFTFLSGDMENGFDDFFVYDGANADAPLIEMWSAGDASGMSWTATSGCITVRLQSDGSVSCNTAGLTDWEFSVQPSPAEYEWIWSPTDYFVDPNLSTLATVQIENVQSTVVYTVTGYPVGLPGCSSSDQVIVTPDPNSSAGEDTELEICPNEPIFDMTAALDGNPAPGGTWTYIGAADDGSFDATVDLEGPYQYEIPAGCTAFLTVSFSDALNFVIPNDTSLCDAGTVSMDLYQLTGTPGYAYTWTYDGLPISNEPSTVFSPLQSGQACLNITDGCNVSNEQCFAVEVLPFVDVQFTADTTRSCWPDGFNLTIETDPSIFTTSLWSISDGNTIPNLNPHYVTFENSGNYNVSLTLINSAGCEYHAVQPLQLTCYAPPIAGFYASPQPTTILDPEISFDAVVEGYPIVDYSWTYQTTGGQVIGQSNLQNPIFEFPNGAGAIYIIELIVTDINGCTAAASNLNSDNSSNTNYNLSGRDGQVVAINDITQFYIPSGFTPNNDGLNDVLKFEGADIDPERFNFEIFNRNGELVFESKDPTSGWAGNIRGGEHFAPNGVYSWRAIVVSRTTGVKKDISGDVIIMR